MNKADLRREMRARRDAITAKDREILSMQLRERIFAMEEYQGACRLMCYAAIGSEPDLSQVIERALMDGKSLYLPRTEQHHVMRAVRFHEGERLALGKMNVPEPQGDETIDPREIDLILVPGVAFDRAGNRMGYGAGYYDRFLVNGSGLKLGVCFEQQLLDALPTDENDIQMDALVTERAQYNIGGHT
ncbi:5-formyltetrahydrofolate cyclo-ligase [Eubacteriales bacterium OttesenSCG-928-N13]|nr:5-formyltetrahydrofolate cyclo-ligase [Eubacteriales bacterium OttesenSCG-928-N13]